MNISAQIVGAVATVLMFATFQFNKRRQILAVQIINAVIWIIHYAMLGAMSGVLINIVCFVRNILFCFRGKNKACSHVLLPITVCAAEIGLTAAVWKGPVDLLAMAGASLQTVSMWSKKPVNIRILSIIASPLWLIYDLQFGSYIGMINETIVIISIIVAFIRYDIRHRNIKMDFYGADTAPQAVRELYADLIRCYDAETCAPRMRDDWSEKNPTLGQCSITAFLVQDLLGGRVLGIPLGDGNYHCFNEALGAVFDLTSAQFGKKQLDYGSPVEQSRETHFSKEEKYGRYLLLKERLEKLRSSKKRI